MKIVIFLLIFCVLVSCGKTKQQVLDELNRDVESHCFDFSDAAFWGWYGAVASIKKGITEPNLDLYETFGRSFTSRNKLEQGDLTAEEQVEIRKEEESRMKGFNYGFSEAINYMLETKDTDITSIMRKYSSLNMTEVYKRGCINTNLEHNRKRVDLEFVN
ncbi:hypothetical protein [Acinetobacter thermotolerans]|uniref:hypothetical protein n=1 Tax=Acinetobacter thermotolerans TaxID=3151487 RepID=UPI00325ACD62